MKHTDAVAVFDTTLRDGEQARGASMTLHDKACIAQALDDAGVNVIEAGFPVASEESFKAVELASSIVQNATVCAIARATERDIDAAVQSLREAKHSRIHTFIATAKHHMEHKLCMSEDDVLERVRSSVTYARRFVAEVEWTPEVASRSDVVFLERAIHVAVKAGASIINVADTTGYMLPHEYAVLIARVVAITSAYDDVVVSAHCHDDLGCAVANSLAALHAGARQVECTVNGIGERAGNAALEEVVVAMSVRKEMLKLEHTVRTERLPELSLLVAEASCTPVAYNKAIVGRNAFSHESGIHQDGVLKAPSLYEEIDPSMVGRTRSLTLGKLSGVAAIKHAIELLGFHPDEFSETMLRTRFKAFADTQGSVDASLFVRFVAELRGSEK